MNHLEVKQLLILALILFLISLLTGLVLYFFPPKAINKIYGYRTPRAMKSIENWQYANKTSAKAMLFSALSFLFVIIFYLDFLAEKISFESNMIIILSLSVIMTISVIFYTEKKLKAFEIK